MVVVVEIMVLKNFTGNCRQLWLSTKSLCFISIIIYRLYMH